MLQSITYGYIIFLRYSILDVRKVLIYHDNEVSNIPDDQEKQLIVTFSNGTGTFKTNLALFEFFAAINRANEMNSDVRFRPENIEIFKISGKKRFGCPQGWGLSVNKEVFVIDLDVEKRSARKSLMRILNNYCLWLSKKFKYGQAKRSNNTLSEILNTASRGKYIIIDLPAFESSACLNTFNNCFNKIIKDISKKDFTVNFLYPIDISFNYLETLWYLKKQNNAVGAFDKIFLKEFNNNPMIYHFRAIVESIEKLKDFLSDTDGRIYIFFNPFYGNAINEFLNTSILKLRELVRIVREYAIYQYPSNNTISLKEISRNIDKLSMYIYQFTDWLYNNRSIERLDKRLLLFIVLAFVQFFGNNIDRRLNLLNEFISNITERRLVALRRKAPIEFFTQWNEEILKLNNKLSEIIIYDKLKNIVGRETRLSFLPYLNIELFLTRIDEFEKEFREIMSNKRYIKSYILDKLRNIGFKINNSNEIISLLKELLSFFPEIGLSILLILSREFDYIAGLIVGKKNLSKAEESGLSWILETSLPVPIYDQYKGL